MNVYSPTLISIAAVSKAIAEFAQQTGHDPDEVRMRWITFRYLCATEGIKVTTKTKNFVLGYPVVIDSDLRKWAIFPSRSHPRVRPKHTKGVQL